MIKPYSIKNISSGFTVVELLVTLGIVVLVTGIVMINYASFNSSVLLTSQAYLTGFDLREAQSLAISVRGNASQFTEEYGMYFSMSTPDRYSLFQDNNANGDNSPARYNAGEAIGTPYKVDARFTITNLCATNSSSRTCYADDPATTGEVIDPALSDLAISFKRPDFDADIYSSAKSNIISAEIHFGSAGVSHQKKVVVQSSGQINID